MSESKDQTKKESSGRSPLVGQESEQVLLMSCRRPNPKIKGARSGFMFFVQEERTKYEASKKELDFQVRATNLGKDWKALSEQDRSKYDEKYKQDKQRYEREITENTGPRWRLPSSSVDDKMDQGEEEYDSDDEERVPVLASKISQLESVSIELRVLLLEHRGNISPEAWKQLTESVCDLAKIVKTL